MGRRAGQNCKNAKKKGDQEEPQRRPDEVSLNLTSPLVFKFLQHFKNILTFV